jgi:hypothetical protein
MDSDSKTPEPATADQDRARRAQEAFVRGLIERGEAAKVDENGNLPAGATHEIIGTSPSGLPIVVRRRFYAAKPLAGNNK